jgi:WhiB family redox-sensing transcriptional regulator
MTMRMNWREDAAYGDADPDLFFPIGTTGNALRQIDEAKRICRFCPVQIQCLAWALENGVTDGVWGGATEDERRAIRSLSRRKRTNKEDNAALLAPWFSRRTVADLAAAFAGTSMPWARLHNVTG